MDVLRPREIEVVGGGDGPPSVALHGAVAERAAELGVQVHISLTHTRSTAGAVAVLR
jgi:holo-[acyl-carrier protein] synthase